MEIKAVNEAARALILWTSLRSDIAHRSPDPQARQAAHDFMGLLTPVVKGVFTDYGFANAVAAQQMFGGHGYVEEWGMSQFVRDARIAMIYEGANGVQAMDLVGRKLARDGGRAVMSFFDEVSRYCREQGENEAMQPFTAPLAEALGHLQQATMWFMNNAMARPDNAGAGATDYMHLFGLVAMGYMWAKMAEAALRRSAEPTMRRTMEARLATGHHFMQRILPETALRLKRIETGADTTMALAADQF